MDARIQPVPRDDEPSLVTAALAGDRDAFDALARPQLAPLRAHTRAAFRSRPDLDPDEAVQQTLVRAFEALDVFDPRYRFAQYLFGIAGFVVRRHLCATPREVVGTAADREDDGGPAELPVALMSGIERALAGADRFAPPDACTLDHTVLRELLSAVLTHGGYPHQQLAFAFATVLWGRRKIARSVRPGVAPGIARPAGKVPITSDPDRVVRELSRHPLNDLRERFRRELEQDAALAADDLAPAFVALDYRLRLTAGELFAADRVSARQSFHLLGRRVGGTCLDDYYGHDSRKSVADWIAAVKRRSLRFLAGSADLLRSPLPMPPNLGPGHGNRDAGAVERS